MRKLTGSEKQVAWAEDIREKMFAGAVEALKKSYKEGNTPEGIGFMEKVIRDIQDITSAKWFIDNRNAGILYGHYHSSAFYMAWADIETRKSIWAEDRGQGEYIEVELTEEDKAPAPSKPDTPRRIRFPKKADVN